MPSPLGRVAPKGPGEVRHCVAFIAVFRRIRTAARPHPPLPRFARRGTFPKGEGLLGSVVAVDLDVIVGQVAAPGGGGVGTVTQGDQDLDLLLQEDFLGDFLGEGNSRAVFADGDGPLPERKLTPILLTSTSAPE